MEEPVVIKVLNSSDIYPEMFADFRHRKVITEKWVKIEGHYELIKTDEVAEWGKEKKIWVSSYMNQQIKNGGQVAAAFSGDRIIGFASLGGDIEEASGKYVNLTMLFVDDEWQRQGVGTALFRRICALAKGMKADKIFISAVPSRETIAFYFKMGCRDASCVPENFVDTEDDRYLEYDL